MPWPWADCRRDGRSGDRGQITALDKREIRNEKTIIMIEITDFTDTIGVKMFARNDQVAEILEGVKKGGFTK